MYDGGRVQYLLTQERTPEVIDELLALNFGLINLQLRRFYLLDNPDALSFAYEALYNAIKTFDIKKNHKFSTYATVCIYNRLGSYIRSMHVQLAVNTVSYDAPLTEDGLTRLDMLESPDTADGAILDKCGVSDINRIVNETIANIKNPLHKSIVETWVDSEYLMTHSKIAEELSCTQSYVSQVIKVFKTTLKKKLEGTL